MIEVTPQVTSHDKELDYYMSLSYPIQLVYDLEEGDWEAQILDLPGCMSDGKDPNEAVENVRDAQLGWIDSCLEDGDEVPLPSTENTYVATLGIEKEKEAAV